MPISGIYYEYCYVRKTPISISVIVEADGLDWLMQVDISTHYQVIQPHSKHWYVSACKHIKILSSGSLALHHL